MMIVIFLLFGASLASEVSQQPSGGQLGASNTSNHHLETADVEEDVDAAIGDEPSTGETNLTGSDRNIPGYTYLDGFGFYKFSWALKTWEQARKECERDGASLAVMESQAEMDALLKFKGDTFHWMGISRADQDSPWMTVYGQRLDSLPFAGWRSSEPKGPGNCVAIYSLLEGKLGGIGSYDCTDPISPGYICEQHL